MQKTYQNFIRSMNILFPKVDNFLNGDTDFQFLVAILLSAQMTDKGVNNATKTLFKKMKTPQDAIELGELKIYKYIKSINFAPTKAKNIVKTAQYLIDKFSGKVPKKRSELIKLFGVGNKTAGVFVVQRGYEDAFPVDTHISRVSIAFGFTAKENKNNPDVIEKDLRNIFPKRTWRMLHKQIILYGRTFLTARNIPLSIEEAWNDLEKYVYQFGKSSFI